MFWVNFHMISQFVIEAIRVVRSELVFVLVVAGCVFLSRLLQRKQGGTAQPQTCQATTHRTDADATSQRWLPKRAVRARSRSHSYCVSPHNNRARRTARSIISESTRVGGQALLIHENAVKDGVIFSTLPESEANRMYTTLVLAALKLDKLDAVVPLLQDMRHQRLLVPTALLTLIARKLVERRSYLKCLTAYDVVFGEGPGPRPPMVDDHNFWSGMLLSAVETGEFSRCERYWSSLQASLGGSAPSPQDYWHMARSASALNDWRASQSLVAIMSKHGIRLDCNMCGVLLSTCVTARQLSAAKGVLDVLEASGVVGDVVSYNTLMKGYALADELDEAFALHARMREVGVEATQVTFGILLDGCVNREDFERAAHVFGEMVQAGCPMNAVLYTTLIKGLAKANRTDEAMAIYSQMCDQSDVKPDVIMFSVLIKANCDAGRMEAALRVFDSMLDQGHRADEIVFNSLLAGCVNEENASLGRKLLDDMLRAGVQPSHATASILIKLYARCRRLDEAQRFLAEMPEELGINPEPRLFAQLVHANIRERQGRRAVQVYRMLPKPSRFDAAANKSILGACINFNMLDTAIELLEIIVDVGGEVSGSDLQLLQLVAERKGRSQATARISAAAAQLVQGAWRRGDPRSNTDQTLTGSASTSAQPLLPPTKVRSNDINQRRHLVTALHLALR